MGASGRLTVPERVVQNLHESHTQTFRLQPQIKTHITLKENTKKYGPWVAGFLMGVAGMFDHGTQTGRKRTQKKNLEILMKCGRNLETRGG